MDLRSQQRVQAEPRPVNTPQVSQVAPSHPQHPGGKRGLGSKRNIVTVVIALVVLVGLIAGVMTWRQTSSGAVKSDRYQAVFLSNGQVYFGKISSMTDDSVVLHDIYYLQQAADVQQQDSKDKANQQNQLTLAKLGKELHGPEDTMFIERSQVLFWENLTNESQVVQTIKKEKDQN